MTSTVQTKIMASDSRRSPASSSQLIAEEFGTDDDQFVESADLQWTREDLEVNLKTVESKVAIVDDILQTIETFDALDDVAAEADILCDSLWMDGKLFGAEPQLSSDHQLQPSVTELQNFYNTLNNGAFTPPQTPPYDHQSHIHAIAAPNYGLQHTATASQVAQQTSMEYLVIPMDIPPYTPTTTQQTDVDRELAVVEELVRSRADNFMPSSPSASSNSSSGSCDSSSEDCEWAPEVKTSKTSRRRAKPYSCVDDKRSRKKEQNKNAATRYRMKKKAEVAEIQTEETSLEQQKVTYQSQIIDLEREIKVLKGLMRDFFKEKGLIR